LPEVRVLIVADGAPDPEVMDQMRVPAAGPRPILIAADGGARAAEDAGWLPDLIVGDADSLSASEVERYRGLGVSIFLHSPAKDQSDTELALHAALARDAAQIRLTGVLGGPRIEHAIANLLLLADPRLDDRDVAIQRGESTIRRLGTQDGPGSLEIQGRAGDFVSLLPLDAQVTGIRTNGLRFALADETLTLGPTRGLSNELLGERGDVHTTSGRLLVVHTPRSGGRTTGDGS
jgi:thiamine pyrophosphokinase